MKYLGKEPIYSKPPTQEYEESWERVFGNGDDRKPSGESKG